MTELFSEDFQKRTSLPPYQASIRLQSDVFSLQLIDNVIQSCINRSITPAAADETQAFSNNPHSNGAAFQRIKELWTKQVTKEIG